MNKQTNEWINSVHVPEPLSESWMCFATLCCFCFFVNLIARMTFIALLSPEDNCICTRLAFLSRRRRWPPLQHSCLENPMDRGAWWATVHGVAKSRTRLNDFTFTFHFHALEKAMATHSSVLAWRIPGTGEPGGLPSMGSHRVGHD